jgi:hypothetical protein
MYIGDAWRNRILGTKISQKFQSYDSQNHYIDIMFDVFCDQEFSAT